MVIGVRGRRGRSRPRGLSTPTSTAVYRLFDDLRRLPYVGIAVDLERRLKDHAREKAWWPQVSYAEIAWFADWHIAEDEELHVIRTESPRLNIQGRGGPLQRRPTPEAQQSCGEPATIVFRAVA